MTARDDLIVAAEALGERGQLTFSPAELIAEAQCRGSSYQRTTLMSMVTNHLLVDGSEGSVRDGFIRVGRGQYRLSRRAERGSQTADVAVLSSSQPSAVDEAISSTPSSDQRDSWFWEGRVQAAVVRALASDGWDILRVAGTASREHGIDIEARRDGVDLYVEVKGYPGATYSRGPKAGEPKTYGAATQARTYFGNALLSGLLLRADHPAARVVLGFPAMETYRSLARRVARPLGAAAVEVWLVDEAGHIEPSRG